MRDDVRRRGPNNSQPATARIGTTVCWSWLAKVGPTVEVEQADQRDVEHHERDRDRDDAHEAEHREHGRRATSSSARGSRHVTPTRTLDWIVKYQNTLKTRAPAVWKCPPVLSAATRHVMTSSTTTSTNVAANHGRAHLCDIRTTLRQNGHPAPVQGDRTRPLRPPTPARARRRHLVGRGARAPGARPRGCCSSRGCTPRRAGRRWCSPGACRRARCCRRR